MSGVREIRTPGPTNPIETNGVRRELMTTDERVLLALERIEEQNKVTNYYLARLHGEELEEPDSLKE